MEDQQTYFDGSEEKLEQSYIALMIHNARRTFRANLPLDIISMLEGRYLVAMGCVAYSITFALFCAFFVVGYIQSTDNTFISTDYGSGTCHEVGRALTGTFLASSDGLWEGSKGFQYHNARYVFKFTDLVVTSQEFRHLIRNQFDLRPLVSFMRMHDLPSNLIAFTNYVNTVEIKGKAQTLTLEMSPSGVFNRNYRAGRVYNSNVTSCFADGLLYDGSATTYAFLFGKKPNNENCVQLTDYMVNYNSKVMHNFGIFRLDMNTFAAAMAVNLKLLSLSEFEVVEEKGTLVVSGVQLRATRVHNPRFPSMGPLACVEALNAPGATWSPFCAIEQEDKMFLPTLSHFNKSCYGCGNRASRGTYADTDMDWKTNDQADIFDLAQSDVNPSFSFGSGTGALRGDCNVLDLVASLVFVPISPLKASYAELLKLAITFTATELNEVVGQSYHNDSLLFQVCPLCTVVSANLYDSSQIVGQYGQTLTDAHCVKRFDANLFYKLGDTPPQQLVENYFECTSTTFASFFYAIGFAFGNTGTFAPIILIILVPLIFCLMSCVGFTAPFDQYGEEVTSDATKEMIRALLRVQDGKIESLPENSVMRQLIAELRDVNQEVDIRRSNSFKAKKSTMMEKMNNNNNKSNKSHHFSGQHAGIRNSIDSHENNLQLMEREKIDSSKGLTADTAESVAADEASSISEISVEKEERLENNYLREDVYEDHTSDLLPEDII